MMKFIALSLSDVVFILLINVKIPTTFLRDNIECGPVVKEEMLFKDISIFSSSGTEGFEQFW